MRKVVNPILMQPKVIKGYVSCIDGVAAELVDNMNYFARQNGKGEMPDNFLDELYKFALESVALVAVDRKIGKYNNFSINILQYFFQRRPFARLINLTGRSYNYRRSQYSIQSTSQIRVLFASLEDLQHTRLENIGRGKR